MQIAHLEAWALLERDHSGSLLGATEALKASTVRLPIAGKATVDIQNLKDAVSSAVEMMQAMASSMWSLSKVEEMNSLVAELVSLAAKEKALLERCKDFLSALAAIQVNSVFCFMFQALFMSSSADVVHYEYFQQVKDCCLRWRHHLGKVSG
ncbi:hypothetical protein F3Y22_tig00008289pilonHSYRG00078 [Hibiscus syriacus]|uniref:Uncharacterized protein n=1 Tax=Hibiscus syriacus TaxID=106335 RepID=A0A6A3CES0_HIBSY|nr:hypothetical protein F3Y22_tig00008289pilonHSYRG00078 [Hibiscus syriacus]